MCLKFTPPVLVCKIPTHSPYAPATNLGMFTGSKRGAWSAQAGGAIYVVKYINKGEKL